MKMIKRLLFLFLLGTIPFTGKAQELNAQVKINRDKIQGTLTVFETLEKALTEFINNRKWTDATFAVNERIDCTFNIIINEMPSDNSFKSEIQIQARRPVYNSTYTTTLLNFRDTQLDFDYTEYEPLEFTENTLNSNLIGTLVFYIYTIIGLDFDSFSPKGGTAFYQQAQQIVNLAQAQASWNGWKAFDSDRNRHAVATALTDNTSDAFRDMWYNYHRKGLDEMAANVDRGRTTIIELLPTLEEIKKTRPTSVLLQMFADAKLDEVVAIYSKATTTEKQEGYKMLSNLYPAMTTRLEALKK
ncbi:type IX secretion system protein PorD [Parabacteroides sp.]